MTAGEKMMGKTIKLEKGIISKRNDREGYPLT